MEFELASMGGNTLLPTEPVITHPVSIMREALKSATDEALLQELTNVTHAPLSRCTADELKEELVRRGLVS